MIVTEREAAEPDDAIPHYSITTKVLCKDKRTAYQMCTYIGQKALSLQKT